MSAANVQHDFLGSKTKTASERQRLTIVSKEKKLGTPVINSRHEQGTGKKKKRARAECGAAKTDAAKGRK